VTYTYKGCRLLQAARILRCSCVLLASDTTQSKRLVGCRPREAMDLLEPPELPSRRLRSIRLSSRPTLHRTSINPLPVLMFVYTRQKINRACPCSSREFLLLGIRFRTAAGFA